MGDRSYAQISFVPGDETDLLDQEVPAAVRTELVELVDACTIGEAAATLLDEHGFSTTAWPPPAVPVATVEWFEDYTEDDANLGVLDELSPKLQRLGLAFHASQDPCYEWDGQTVMHHPEIGHFDGWSGSESGIHLTAYELDALADNARRVKDEVSKEGAPGGIPAEIALSELLEAIEAATGRRLREWFDTKTKQHEYEQAKLSDAARSELFGPNPPTLKLNADELLPIDGA